MNPSNVIREKVTKLTDQPNIGKACAADLELLGIYKPADLLGHDPFDMYYRLCDITAVGGYLTSSLTLMLIATPFGWAIAIGVGLVSGLVAGKIFDELGKKSNDLVWKISSEMGAFQR